MKIKRKISISLAMFGALCIVGRVASAKPAQPKTVLDYFLLLPNKSYFAVPLSKSQRKTWLRDRSASIKPIVDIKNDYLLFPGDGAQGTIQFAIFRHKGRALVVVRDDFEDGSLDFLRYESGHWKDVTKQMMPAPYNVRYDYQVPRYGTTIKVTAGRDYFKDTKPTRNKGKRLYDLVWVNGTFKVRR